MKKRFPQGKYLLPVILLSISCSLRAQNAPITTAGTLIACPSSTITVPVTVTAFNSISSMNLKIEYDSVIMTYNDGLTFINPLLPGAFKNSVWTHQGSIWEVDIVWTDFATHNLADGSTLVTLGFNYINGTTSLHFNNTSNNGHDCEYARFVGSTVVTLIDTPTSTYYHDGLVSSGAVGGTVTGGSNITFGNSTGTLTLSGYVGNIVKWQKQYDGGGYADITNTNTTYSETPIYSGTWDYRAVVQYGSCSPANSNPTTVTVTSSGNSKTWAGTVSTDWKNPLNWNPFGIPMLTENVTIPSGVSNMPYVGISSMPYVFPLGMGCNNLSVAHDASLTINPGFHLNINGTLNISGP